ncbi:MAG: sulfatase-like hydrolase/transferase [Spirochaetaceae bacterium]
MKKNIVFFFTDDQRFDTISALGNKDVITPNMDRLVHNGTTFTHAHIPCGTSGAVCMPSRAMLHTGRTLFHLQDEGQEIPEEHITLGETLQKAGYETFGTGKWHNGTSSYARSFTAGGEIFFGGMFDHWNVPAYNFDPTGKYDKTVPYATAAFSSRKLNIMNTDHITPGKHSSELFGEVSAEWIKNYSSDKPFFSYISFMAPHDPRTMPEKFKNMYNAKDIPLPENYLPEHPFDFGIRDLRDEVLAPYPRQPQEVKEHIAEYYGMITHLDNEMGKVIKAVEDRGELEYTLFIFAGDNGLALGQHGLFGKQNHYEHSIRVPLIFSGPGIPKGELRDSYAYLLDIYPTICEYLKLDKPGTVEGKSLIPLIDNVKAINRETLYFAYTDIMRGVKDDRYKLIEYATHCCRKTQLFDLKNDPNEMNDLSDDLTYLGIKNNLRSQMYILRDEWDDKEHPLGKKFWERY